jgi:hypothetical protein
MVKNNGLNISIVEDYEENDEVNQLNNYERRQKEALSSETPMFGAGKNKFVFGKGAFNNG